MYHTNAPMLFALLFAFFANTICHAQKKTRKTYRHEISAALGVGRGTDTRFKSYYRNLETLYDLNDNSMHFGFRGAWGGYSLQYYYRINRRVAFGATGGIMSSGMGYNNHGIEIITPDGRVIRDFDYDYSHAKQRTFYFMPTAKWIWTDGRRTRLYMKAGVGGYCQKQWMTSDYYKEDITAQHDKTIWMPTYQITPFGLEFGRNWLCFFMELGYGMNGIFNIGLTYRFKRTDNHLQ